MSILRFVVWTALCIGLGLFLGTYEVAGRTPWRAIQAAWKQQGPRLDRVKDEAEELVDGVKKKVSSHHDGAAQPKERHLKEDREAIDQIISQHSKG